ncbi:MAG: hypothetical protein ACRDZQ_14550 [Acidimicrobiales bacterium]
MTTTTASPPPVGPSTTARPSTTSSPTTTAARPTTTASAGGYLTGFGATRATWAAGHTPDPSGPAGSYWPRLSDGKDSYASVRFVGGRALAYTENLYPPLTATEARAVVGDELPPDAHTVSATRGPSGERVVDASPTLHAATGDEVAVLLQSPGPAYDPSDVTVLVYSAVRAGSASGRGSPS